MGDRRALRPRDLFHRSDAHRRRGEPVRAAQPGAGRGRGAQPAAPPPRDGDPPADALLGLRPVLDPVRVRDRGIGRAAARRQLDPLDPALRPARMDLPHLRGPARRGMVVHGARLGRLLGVGPGRERLADAVARRDGVPALDHGPGAPRHAEGVERVADLRHVRALPARHVPGALRDPGVDPRVRRLHGGDATAGADRRRPRRLDRADRLAPARAAGGAAGRVAGVARGRVPRQQPAVGRPLPDHLLGHVLPADLRGDHGRALVIGRAVVRPLRDAARARAGAVHRHRSAPGLAPAQRRPGD